MTSVFLIFTGMSLFLNLILSNSRNEMIYSAINFLLFFLAYLFLRLSSTELNKLYPLFISIGILISIHLIISNGDEKGEG